MSVTCGACHYDAAKEGDLVESFGLAKFAPDDVFQLADREHCGRVPSHCVVSS